MDTISPYRILLDIVFNHVKACSPLSSLSASNDAKSEGISSAKPPVDHYADVNVRDVTCFIRSSKCPELTQIRLDSFQLDRTVKLIKSRMTGLAGNITQFIGTKIKCQTSDKMDEPFAHLKEMNINCEMVDMNLEKIILEVPNNHLTQLKWSPRTHILIHESIKGKVNNHNSTGLSATFSARFSARAL